MRKIFFIMLALILTGQLQAQDDLFELLEDESAPVNELVFGTFKGTRLINGHSVETRNKGALDFLIMHRFGLLNSGGYNLWGLDQAGIRLGLEYAISNRLSAGIGRSSFEKTYDSYLKYRLLRQSTGAKPMPVSVTLFTSLAVKSDTLANPELKLFDKAANTVQILIARKISPDLSLQIMPTFIHFNTINANQLSNDLLAIGAGGRYKLTKRLSINAEYYHQVNRLNSNSYNAIAIGVDIETGGHVFQLQFTNATSMVEKGFIAENTFNDFFSGDIHFGFNISRTFQLKSFN
jgi:hypothetical protein